MMWNGSRLRYALPFLLITISVVLLLPYCSDPTSTKEENSPVVSSEKWHLVEPEFLYYADIIIDAHENGTSTCSGSWHYSFFGYAITCNIMKGYVEKDSTFYSFVCTGTAEYPPNSTGHIESSPFELKMSGQFKNSNATGTWIISFSKEEWADWGIDGEFTGTKQ